MDASTNTSDTGSGTDPVTSSIAISGQNSSSIIGLGGNVTSGSPSVVGGPTSSSNTQMEMRLEHGKAVNSADNDSGFWPSTIPTVAGAPLPTGQAWIPTFYPFSFPGVPQLHPPFIFTAYPIKQERDEEEPLYVNPKQYERILKRREARAKLVVSGRIPTERPKYLHESRHQHALNRVRQWNGKFEMVGATRGRGQRCPPVPSKPAVGPSTISTAIHTPPGLGNRTAQVLKDDENFDSSGADYEEHTKTENSSIYGDNGGDGGDAEYYFTSYTSEGYRQSK